MKFIQGQNRDQLVLIPDCLDSLIEPANEIRVIDLFVDSLDLKNFKFYVKESEEGRPAYHPKDLLKLFIYGYLNSIRSSRKLEQECKRNIELMWLLKQLTPDHNTISNFRRDNGKAIKQVFRATVKMAQYFDLIGGKLIAGDSTKLRAQNSKKNNFNQKKIDRHLAYIENKLHEYEQALEQADGDQQQTEIRSEITKHQNRKRVYQRLEQELHNSDQEQISTSDPESRQMIVRNNITEVAYNIQSVTDAKHCLPIEYKVTNNNDSKAMGNMLRRTKSYFTGSELKTAIDLGIDTLVAIPDPASGSPNPKYNVSEFQYNSSDHTYTCPQGHILKTNGNWYSKNKNYGHHKSRIGIQVQQFKTTACKNCPALRLCTKNTKGRVLERNQHQVYFDINKQNMLIKEHIYKKRQAIIEHNYGTIKRQWNFHYILTKKGKQRAAADVGFMFVAYNLRRILNLIDTKVLKEYLRILCPDILAKFSLFKGYLTKYKPAFSQNQLFCSFRNPIFQYVNSLYLNLKLNVSLSF
jgi:transposase